jgi:erythromycin esterase
LPSGFPLAFRAPVSGLYLIEAAGWENRGTPFTMQLDEVVPAKLYSKRNKALSNDSRTDWLRNNAAAIRSIDPDNEDFSDLVFLREQLSGVRVVMLGESDHGNGADFKAKTRLIKFLHQEMGFDVLAMESGIFGTSVAWRAFSKQAEPREAFLQGVFPVWGLSEQLQPLIHYLAESAQTDHPLELAGFDCQFREPAARDSLVPSLREFLTRSGIRTQLCDTNSRPAHILEWAIGRRIPPNGEPKPQSTEKDEFLQILKTTTDAVERSIQSREGQFWSQVLRSVTKQISLYYYWNSPETPMSFNEELRDLQMGENLVWLANSYYPGHKIIVWAATAHTMRNPHRTTEDELQKYHAGQHVWEALGNESFVIGMTSYTGMAGCITCRGGMEGQIQNIMPDQDPSFEFEELMDGAGYKFGFVNLRKARKDGQWPGGSFAARPLFNSYIAPWSEMIDALFFIQNQEPSRIVTDIR